MTRRIQIVVDQSLCVGNGTCLTVAPRVFAHDAYRQSTVVDPAGEPEARVLEAAAQCPVGAIQVSVFDTGERLYPPHD